jgi:FlaG/FlaF family flagellin (archaellin)
VSSSFVSGVVTLDSSPVEEATLQFYPASGDGQTSHAVTDKAGKFSAKVSPVTLVVTITKSAPTGEKMQSFPDSPPVDVMAESLSPRYSDRNKTELKVTPVEGKTTVADFTLTSDAE